MGGGPSWLLLRELMAIIDRREDDDGNIYTASKVPLLLSSFLTTFNNSPASLMFEQYVA